MNEIYYVSFQDKLESVILSCKAAVEDSSSIKTIWDGVSGRMFSLVDRQKELGLGKKVKYVSERLIVLMRK